MDDKDLACESMPKPSVVALCWRVQQNLEYTRGGHALITGNPGYYCTERTAIKVFCTGVPIVVADIEEVRAATRSRGEDELKMDSRLGACLDWLVDVTTASAEKKNMFYKDFRCDAGAK